MPARAAPLPLRFASPSGQMLSLSRSPRSKLDRVFTYKGFRPLQGDIIATVLDGGYCLASMPTGGGTRHHIPWLLSGAAPASSFRRSSR